ncbi:aspartyl protease [Phenylobacterium sp. Root77]|jgi:aspartyl protease family protein|uniref:TIGR02281 family clan AA aspartic protease n=1 Tax=unclassified Phenylobacterium TaxID=2640670 RepID=UPI0006FB56D5|nr:MULTISPECIES: TIGR02281 family clan AA aspartic protease [unclassified Phenylobacterium]KQW72213.1 aspartyl protease [Phenylobacterium sp. Root1277]KQW95133.1 aspartyl protease [Phenylobacterium sp. Root1290]KRC44826.1 aspartyl protease [Phenylobacterium sp. Root77]
MLKLAVVALLGAVSAVGAAEALDTFTNPKPELRAALAIAPQTAPHAQAASIAKGGDGHYWAEADVNGSRVRFLVDTGASAVALTLADAQRLGIATDKLDYNYNVVTASGQTRAAAVTLGRVSVAGAALNDVEALVIESGLESSLLGMTYLGRLASFEATRTALILRP